MITDLPNNLSINSFGINPSYMKGGERWEPEFQSDFDLAVYYAGKNVKPRGKNQIAIRNWMASLGLSFNDIKNHRQKIRDKLKKLTDEDDAWEIFPYVLVPKIPQSFSVKPQNDFEEEDDDDEIPEGLDELLGSIEDQEEKIPKGLDDLLKETIGKINKKSAPKTTGALATILKKPDNLVDEEIDSRILSILGLEDVFDLTYEEYALLLKEAAVKGRMPNSQMTTESIELVTSEFKRVKGKAGKFKVKSKKVNINAVFNRRPGAIVKVDSLQQEDQKSEKSESIESELINGIGNILESLITIRNVLEKQSDIEKKGEENERLINEEEKRREKEKNLERKNKKGLKIQKAIESPVTNFFDTIKKFFTNILLGSAVVGALNWLQNSENKQKVDGFFNFLSEHGPTIVKGLLALIALRIGWKVFKFAKMIYDAFKSIKNLRKPPTPTPAPKPTIPKVGTNLGPTGSAKPGYTGPGRFRMPGQARAGGFFLEQARKASTGTTLTPKNTGISSSILKPGAIKSLLKGGTSLGLSWLGSIAIEKLVSEPLEKKIFNSKLEKYFSLSDEEKIKYENNLRNGILKLESAINSPMNTVEKIAGFGDETGNERLLRLSFALLQEIEKKKTQSSAPKDPYAGADGLQRQLDDLAKAQQPAVQPQTSIVPEVKPNLESTPNPASQRQKRKKKKRQKRLESRRGSRTTTTPADESIQESLEKSKEKGEGKVNKTLFGEIKNIYGMLDLINKSIEQLWGAIRNISSGESPSYAPSSTSGSQIQSYSSETEDSGRDGKSGSAKVVPASHPETGSGYTVQGQIDQNGRPVVFSSPAAQQFARAVEDSGMNLGEYVASSGRSQQKNDSIDGHPNSHHMYGEALDMNGAGYEWMKRNGSKYGWRYVYNHNSQSAHFKYVGPGAGSTPKLSSPGSRPAPAQIVRSKPRGPSIGPPRRSSGNRIVTMPSRTSGGNAASTSSGGQSPVPFFSSEDPNNMTTMVVKGIYNVVG